MPHPLLVLVAVSGRPVMAGNHAKSNPYERIGYVGLRRQSRRSVQVLRRTVADFAADQ